MQVSIETSKYFSQSYFYDKFFYSVLYFAKVITIITAVGNTKSQHHSHYDGGSEGALHNFPRIEVELAILSSSLAI